MMMIWMSIDCWVSCRRVCGVCWRVSLTIVMVNGKDWNHLFAIDWRVSVPLDVMLLLWSFQILIAFVWLLLLLLLMQTRRNWIVSVMMIKMFGIRIGRWTCVRNRRWHLIWWLIGSTWSPHQHSLTMNCIVWTTSTWRWILKFRLNRQNFRSCWIRSIGCNNVLTWWRRDIHRWALRCLLIDMRVLDYLVKDYNSFTVSKKHKSTVSYSAWEVRVESLDSLCSFAHMSTGFTTYLRWRVIIEILSPISWMS